MARKSSGEEDYVGDKEILNLLEESRMAFEAGDNSALLMCVFRCAAFQAVIPEWATDALIALREDVESGRIADYKNAFKSNKPIEKANTRAARARMEKVKPDVLVEILRERTEGTSLTDDEMFPAVVENLRDRGVSVKHRDVRTIYGLEGKFLKEVPRKPKPTDGYGTGSIIFPKPRRRGRNILED